MEVTDLLTVQDAARESGLTEDAIRKALLRKALPFVVLYGRKLIRREDWNAYRHNLKRGRPRKENPNP
jgi:hypothetical protein